MIYQLDIPNQSSTQGWKISRSKLEEALEFLEIELPIMIRYKYGMQPTLGDYRCRSYGLYYIVHIIRVNDNLRTTKISEVLWHELGHARQVEQGSRLAEIPPLDFFKQVYLKSGGGLGMEYLNNTFEVDARRIANENKHKELIA